MPNDPAQGRGKASVAPLACVSYNALMLGRTRCVTSHETGHLLKK